MTEWMMGLYGLWHLLTSPFRRSCVFSQLLERAVSNIGFQDLWMGHCGCGSCIYFRGGCIVVSTIVALLHLLYITHLTPSYLTLHINALCKTIDRLYLCGTAGFCTILPMIKYMWYVELLFLCKSGTPPWSSVQVMCPPLGRSSGPFALLTGVVAVILMHILACSGAQMKVALTCLLVCLAPLPISLVWTENLKGIEICHKFILLGASMFDPVHEGTFSSFKKSVASIQIMSRLVQQMYSSLHWGSEHSWWAASVAVPRTQGT